MKPLPGRLVLLAIIALFALPLVLAWMLYTGKIGLQQTSTRNLGTLVVPLVPARWSGTSTATGDPVARKVEGFWVIVHRLPDPCGKSCIASVDRLRKLHRATGRHQDRVRIVLVADSAANGSLREELLAVYPEFIVAVHPEADFLNSLGEAGRLSMPGGPEPDFFLVDPLGNIMMTYSGETGPANMSKDLKNLLTWSKLDQAS